MSVENLITEHIDIWTSAIQAKSASGRGSGKKLELYGIKKLRELILALAVRGKLVPQDPTDEPASVLLARIAAEKTRLVKEGKIKKPKALPEIGEDEKPFALPVGWEWVKLGEIGHDHGQKTPDSLFTYIDVGAINKEMGFIDSPTVISATDAPSRARKIVKSGTVIYSTIRPYLLNIAVIDRDISPEPIASTAFAIIHPFEGILSSYVYRYLRSPCFVSYVENVQTGVAYPAINDKQFFNGIIPIPPTEEQHRIVAKVDELMALCDQLELQTDASIEAHQQLVTVLLDSLLLPPATAEGSLQSPSATAEGSLINSAADDFLANWARISDHFDTLFTTEASIDALKQTILQLAVMGKLVPQDPNDEPASVLLERIAAEKARLVKEKKIKKDKPLPAITDDEKPFSLPKGWEWCRFEDVVDIQSGITKGRKLVGRELKTIPYLSVANVQRGYLSLENVKEIDLPVDELEKYAVEKGDLLITEGGDWDKVGRTAIWRSELPYMAHQNHVFKARPFLSEQSETWLEMYLNGPFARDYFAGSSKQTTNLASINKTQLRACLIAVPPAGEKQQITAKVDELMAICDQLKQRLSDSQQTQLKLTDALVDGALA
ncbi:restriction endonuclease subunit S [Shewanella sp. Shew256]|uniref:restriction endonuclease subunit S n=1 Tax=Shewanella sp. Shew256 TaxID=1969376 RepID=UPI000B49AD8E|nr:restriction endonuclease subunit S [Shewanella sp. Shew256]